MEWMSFLWLDRWFSSSSIVTGGGSQLVSRRGCSLLHGKVISVSEREETVRGGSDECTDAGGGGGGGGF
jgi:hypothetical protein